MATVLDARGERIGKKPLEYAGETSIFEAVVPLEGDPERVVVLASQPDEANFGRAEAELH